MKPYKLLFYKKWFGWYITLERMGYQSRTEFRLRIWKHIEYKKSHPRRHSQKKMGGL